MIETLKPYLRAVKMNRMRASARRIASRPGPHDEQPSGPAPNFIFGSGRSGTTILGKLFMQHPDICYLFEPYHLWAEVDQRTDATNLYHIVDGSFFMDADDCTPDAKLRFNRLIRGARERAGASALIEKTPHNVARIGYLESLAPGSRYLHIVRSGLDVSRSIHKLASTNSYRMAGKPRYNQWWGTDSAKWRSMATGGRDRGYFAEEIDALETHAQKGSYEWLVSLSEIERHRERLGERLIEIRYPDLTADVPGTLRKICEFFDVGCPQAWLDEVVPMVGSERNNAGEPLRLPAAMSERFNIFMERYGFDGRAEDIG